MDALIEVNEKTRYFMSKKARIIYASTLQIAAPIFAAPPPNIIFSDDHSLQPIGANNMRLPQLCRERNITPNLR